MEQPAVAVVRLIPGAQHRQLGQAGEITDAVNGLDGDRPADDLRPFRQGHAHMVLWIMKVLELQPVEPVKLPHHGQGQVASQPRSWL